MNSPFDAHVEELMSQFRERLPLLKQLEQLAFESLNRFLKQQGLYVTAIEHRVKDEKSLQKKLELKGNKYHSIDDVTDLIGLRIITFYTDDVDKIAAIVKNEFEVDWQNSVDKRKLHQLTSFGYNSLHYICKLPKSIVDNDALNNIRFELQMRTALQHVWSTIEHDTGYKGSVQLPNEYRRQFSRLAGMLELIDDEFSRLRTTLNDYRRQMQALVKSGQLEEVPLSSDTFRHYLELHPFERLNERIAAVNQAEIYPVSLMPFLKIFKEFRMETLKDIDQFINDNSEDAYQLALSQLAMTDLDILSENVGLQNLCFVYVLKNGGGRPGIKHVYDILNGKQETNGMLAEIIIQQAANLPFMHNNV